MPYKPGESGNLKGSPRKSLSLAEAIRQRFPVDSLLAVAAQLLKSDDDKVRLQTLQLLWDRAFGRAPTTVEIVAASPTAHIDWAALPTERRVELMAAMVEVSQISEAIDVDESIEH